MKILALLILFVSLSTTSITQAQDSTNKITLNETSIIKDFEGNVISFEKCMTLMDSGEWTIERKIDLTGDGYFQLRKISPEEKSQMARLMALKSPEKGTVAPVFSFEDIKGNIISTETTKGKVVVLNFWFTTCRPCIEELPELNAVYKKYANRNDIVFASVTFETEEKVTSFLQKRSLNYPVVANEQESSRAFTNGSYPTNVVLGKDGTYHSAITGGYPQIGATIENSIEEALAN